MLTFSDLLLMTGSLVCGLYVLPIKLARQHCVLSSYLVLGTVVSRGGAVVNKGAGSSCGLYMSVILLHQEVDFGF